MTLKSIMIKGFDGDCESRPRFNRSCAILFDPPLEYTTKTPLAKERFWSEIPSCQLEVYKRELAQPRRNFEFFFEFAAGRIAFSIASCGGWDYRGNRLIFTCPVCRFTFCSNWQMKKCLISKTQTAPS